ncbi:energy-coupling factor transport system ATP-binding protein [Caldanaerobius fijiensis DSM 17918]|uniref:Energy-coupling factor transporter ATP-binding protein EcfA2 n=1 Tax=Caldanaerobius fijiensis DSM 17918 TaxID=1121256 RepID=A0A1M4YRK4_9THEO|nr:energy-coupling factor transporter ATPase [Caldanaerobius fijiensis]SHF08424.1 energy-coupling factor transport system ATP-binding protein [Caldanaerobius fijiensis DSM 17918]
MSIVIKDLTYIYNKGTPFEAVALDNINLTIDDGEFIAIIGHTGSGKSTLIQQMNGLLKPTSGQILIDDIDITVRGSDIKKVRQKVGLVFQYPEHQLFEETIYKDIAFGPINMGLDEKEVEKRVRYAMELVELDYETLKDKSPFEISGGQKRRVAIAGVLAMKPKVLILDEPTAGLDPKGRDEILGNIKKLHQKENMTIVLVSHSMEDVAKYANRIVVMNKGRVAMTGKPAEVFARMEELKEMGLGVPQVTQLMKALKDKGFDVNDRIYTVDDAKKELIKIIRSKKNGH